MIWTWPFWAVRFLLWLVLPGQIRRAALDARLWCSVGVHEKNPAWRCYNCGRDLLRRP